MVREQFQKYKHGILHIVRLPSQSHEKLISNIIPLSIKILKRINKQRRCNTFYVSSTIIVRIIIGLCKR